MNTMGIMVTTSTMAITNTMAIMNIMVTMNTMVTTNTMVTMDNRHREMDNCRCHMDTKDKHLSVEKVMNSVHTHANIDTPCKFLVNIGKWQIANYYFESIL